jgi:hypothetical protein
MKTRKISKSSFLPVRMNLNNTNLSLPIIPDNMKRRRNKRKELQKRTEDA